MVVCSHPPSCFIIVIIFVVVVVVVFLHGHSLIFIYFYHVIGKTCLLERLANAIYSDQQSPTVEEKYDCTINVRGEEINMSLQDTMGQEAFRQITQSFYQGCQAIIICYDVSDKESFTKVPSWMEEIKKYCTNSNFIPIVLVGNKCDIVDSKAVTFSEGEQYAKKENIPFFETSAKQNVNVEEPFESLVEQLLEGPKLNIKRDPKALLEASGVSVKKKSTCTIL